MPALPTGIPAGWPPALLKRSRDPPLSLSISKPVGETATAHAALLVIVDHRAAPWYDAAFHHRFCSVPARSPLLRPPLATFSGVAPMSASSEGAAPPFFRFFLVCKGREGGSSPNRPLCAHAFVCAPFWHIFRLHSFVFGAIWRVATKKKEALVGVLFPFSVAQPNQKGPSTLQYW